MRQTSRYTFSSERAEVTCDGKPLEDRFEGTLLDAQLELDDGRALLWFTDGCPHDEGLHVYLLDREGAVLDSLEAGYAFTPGILDLAVLGSDWVEFEFFKNRARYRLRVARTARPRWFAPAGWTYKRWLRPHYITVRVVTGGEGDE